MDNVIYLNDYKTNKQQEQERQEEMIYNLASDFADKTFSYILLRVLNK